MPSEWAWQQRDYDKAVERLLQGRRVPPKVKPRHDAASCSHPAKMQNATHFICTDCGAWWAR